MSGTDFGTYHIHVTLEDGRGWIQQWNTGRRYLRGTASESPPTADRIGPTWQTEEDLFDTIRFVYSEDGNYGCDCNKRLFLARAHQEEAPTDEDNPCGDTMPIARIVAERPDGAMVQLYPEKEGNHE